MNLPTSRSGGCLCGAVRYTARGEPARVNACHCSFCQSVSGSAFQVICVYPLDSVDVDGPSLRTWEHRSDESGRIVRVHGCARCGSPLSYTFERFPGVRGLFAGSFDERDWIVPGRHFFVRSARPWIVFPPDVELYERHATTPDGHPCAPIRVSERPRG